MLKDKKKLIAIKKRSWHVYSFVSSVRVHRLRRCTVDIADTRLEGGSNNMKRYRGYGWSHVELELLPF